MIRNVHLRIFAHISCHSSFCIISKTISRVMSWIIIYPILLSPAGFSDPPENVTGSHNVFYSVLLRMGFTYALSVTRKAVVSYTLTGISSGGSFLLHYPWSHLHQTLSGILPFEARTFLTWPLSVLSAAIIYSTYDAGGILTQKVEKSKSFINQSIPLLQTPEEWS